MKRCFGRNLIKRADFLVIFLTLLLIFSSIIILRQSSGKSVVAVVSVDGKTVKEIDLTVVEDCIFELETEPVVTLQVKQGKIRFINSECPDKTCERSGFLSKAGDTAACVPAKTVVTVKGRTSSQIDAVAE